MIFMYGCNLQQLSTTIFSGSMFELRVKNKQSSENKAYLAVSSNQILEVIQNSPPSSKTYHIHGVHQLHSLTKIQFRRGTSITFQLKSGLTKSYGMTEAVACCEYVKKQMRNAGLQVRQYCLICVQPQVNYVHLL